MQPQNNEKGLKCVTMKKVNEIKGGRKGGNKEQNYKTHKTIKCQ